MKQHSVTIVDRKKANAIELPSGLRGTTTPEEEIRQHAYYLYEQRGRQDGRATDDWLEAEREIGKTRTAAA